MRQLEVRMTQVNKNKMFPPKRQEHGDGESRIHNAVKSMRYVSYVPIFVPSVL